MSQFDAAYQNALANPHCRVIDPYAPVEASRMPEKPGRGRGKAGEPGLLIDAFTEPPGAVHSAFRSKTEATYAQYLDWQRASGLVHTWLYEPLSLRLGQNCWYQPDFLVTYAEPGPPVLIEVKNVRYIRDRSLVKPRAAATRFPMFVFALALYRHPEWSHEGILPHLSPPGGPHAALRGPL